MQSLWKVLNCWCFFQWILRNLPQKLFCRTPVNNFFTFILYQGGIYFFKVRIRNTRTMFKSCLKLTIKTSERRHRLRSLTPWASFERLVYVQFTSCVKGGKVYSCIWLFRCLTYLNISTQCCHSYRNHSFNLHCKSNGWFLHGIQNWTEVG